ncbi:MAG: filamentous hemagglutinin N-terminal domain-containing protein, partial [Pirellulales bacterium]|nr:filamentous hemagglutinin N-terminal domain-containing protein [Pirellulales bacterium]
MDEIPSTLELNAVTRLAHKRRRALRRLICGLMFSPTLLPGSYAQAEVTGGTVVAGQATIAQDGSTLNVNTMSDRTIINWQGFSIGAGETANFLQPGANSAVLNRVTTPNNPSAIFGTLNSNGNVILVNPSGIVVGAGGVINTNGFTA